MKKRTKNLSNVDHKNYRVKPVSAHKPSEIPDPLNYFSSILKQLPQFAVGTYFWFIANRIEGITCAGGGNIQELSSLKNKDLIGKDPEILFKRTHPEDLPKIFTYTDYWEKFIAQVTPDKRREYQPSIFFRLCDKHDIFNWVMVQFLGRFVNTNGETVYVLTTVTDVSHMKKSGESTMSILNTARNECLHFTCDSENNLEKIPQKASQISPREKEVLKFLTRGLSSKQIAAEMNITNHTVNNHRQHLLKKTNAKSTAELVAFGLKMGYVNW